MTSAVHPWRTLRDLGEGWKCYFVDLPEGTLGSTDVVERKIFLQRGMSQASRRATLQHELTHVVLPSAREHCVDGAAVRQLIPLERLIAAMQWSYDEREIADELWVDVATVRARLDGLTPAEQERVEEALDRGW